MEGSGYRPSREPWRRCTGLYEVRDKDGTDYGTVWHRGKSSFTSGPIQYRIA